MTYLDMFGVPINVGDFVIYTTGAQGSTLLEVGHVTQLFVKRGFGYASIISPRRRKLANDRLCKHLASTTPIRIQHPELFI